MLALVTPRPAASDDCQNPRPFVSVKVDCPTGGPQSDPKIEVEPLVYCVDQGEETEWKLTIKPQGEDNEIVITPKTRGRWLYRKANGDMADEHRGKGKAKGRNMRPNAAQQHDGSYDYSVTATCAQSGKVVLDPQIKVRR
jgi:hypothetical protein